MRSAVMFILILLIAGCWPYDRLVPLDQGTVSNQSATSHCIFGACNAPRDEVGSAIQDRATNTHWYVGISNPPPPPEHPVWVSAVHFCGISTKINRQWIVTVSSNCLRWRDAIQKNSLFFCIRYKIAKAGLVVRALLHLGDSSRFSHLLVRRRWDTNPALLLIY